MVDPEYFTGYRDTSKTEVKFISGNNIKTYTRDINGCAKMINSILSISWYFKICIQSVRMIFNTRSIMAIQLTISFVYLP